MIASAQSLSMIQRRMLLSPDRRPGEKRRPVVHFGDPTAQPRLVLHLAEHVHEEEQLPVARTRDEVVLAVSGVLDDEARVLDAGLAAQLLQVRLPAFSVGRIRQHEVEFAGNESVG